MLGYEHDEDDEPSIESFWLIAIIDGWFSGREKFETLPELVDRLKSLRASHKGKRLQTFTFYGEEGVIVRAQNNHTLRLYGSEAPLYDPPKPVDAVVVHECDISDVEEEDPDYSKATKSLLEASAKAHPLFEKASKKLTTDDEEGAVDEGEDLSDES